MRLKSERVYNSKNIFVGLATLFGFSVSIPAYAELPSVKLMTAPLVAPSDAWSYYGTGTTHTVGAPAWAPANRPIEIKELARALKRGGILSSDQFAVAVDGYIRNNIRMEFRFGLSKGALGALIDQSGTSFDQAHLMVELLREGGVTASYQVGTITLNAAQFSDWTGFTDAKAACQLLADGGIPATVNGVASCSALTGGVSSITLMHLWVSANGKLYDPSYKRHTFRSGIDIAAALGCGTAASPTCGSSLTNAAVQGAASGTLGGGCLLSKPTGSGC